MHVPAQHGIHPNAGMLAKNHIANDLRRIIDEARTRDGRRNAFVGADHEQAVGSWHLAKVATSKKPNAKAKG
jgi:hypothetical protein